MASFLLLLEKKNTTEKVIYCLFITSLQTELSYNVNIFFDE